MNLKQLIEFREVIEEARLERKHLGEYDANSKYLNFLLDNMAKLVDHELSKFRQAMPGRKVLPGRGGEE
jgi:hypothetical protein